MDSLKIKNQITNRNTDSVDKYLRDITKLGLIDASEEVELSRRIKKGDKIALSKLIKSNLRFVISVAKQYQNMGLEFEDIISEGNIGLIKAAEKFDETKGFKFISYAVWWIRQSILEAIAKQSRVVYLPLNKVNLITKVNKAVLDLEKDLKREPTVDDISKHLEISKNQVEECLKYSSRHLSMDKPINEEGDSIYDIYENKQSVKPDQNLVIDSVKFNISQVLSTLSERESYVLVKNFGLDDNSPMSLEDIAETLNVTKERVRQIKQESIKKIKNTMRSDLLKTSL